MLTIEDLDQMSTYFNEALQKTKKKVTEESNPKIVNFKIRSFLEKVKDLLFKYDEQPTEIVSPVDETKQVEDNT